MKNDGERENTNTKDPGRLSDPSDRSDRVHVEDYGKRTIQTKEPEDPPDDPTVDKLILTKETFDQLTNLPTDKLKWAHYVACTFSDKLLKIIEQQNIPIPCKPGCHWCCYEPCEATRLEGKLGAHAVTLLPAQAKAQVLRNLETWVSQYRTTLTGKNHWVHKGDRDGDAYRKQKLLCPFNVDKLCTIYDYRPVTCRTYFCPQGPEYCKPDRKVYGDLIFSPALSAAHWLLLSEYRQRRSYIFPQLVAEELGLLDNADNAELLELPKGYVTLSEIAYGASVGIPEAVNAIGLLINFSFEKWEAIWKK